MCVCLSSLSLHDVIQDPTARGSTGGTGVHSLHPLFHGPTLIHSGMDIPRLQQQPSRTPGLCGRNSLLLCGIRWDTNGRGHPHHSLSGVHISRPHGSSHPDQHRTTSTVHPTLQWRKRERNRKVLRRLRRVWKADSDMRGRLRGRVLLHGNE